MATVDVMLATATPESMRKALFAMFTVTSQKRGVDPEEWPAVQGYNMALSDVERAVLEALGK